MADLLDDLSGDLFEDPVSTPVAAGRQVQVRKHSQMNISRENTAIMQAALVLPAPHTQINSMHDENNTPGQDRTGDLQRVRLTS